MAVHPSEYIRDEIESRGWSVGTFAEKAMLTEATALGLLGGKRWITHLLAFCLGKAFDTSAELWRNLQHSYDQSVRDENAGKPAFQSMPIPEATQQGIETMMREVGL